MSLSEGVEWTEGGPEPKASITEGVSRWVTTSASPCSECALKNGVVYLDLPGQPAHDWCSCSGESLEMTFNHQGRSAGAVTTSARKEYQGFIPATYGDRERTRTFVLPDGGTQTEECPGPDVAFGNTDSTCYVYWLFELTTTKYVDTYVPTEPVHGAESITIDNVKVETRFLGQIVEQER